MMVIGRLRVLVLLGVLFGVGGCVFVAVGSPFDMFGKRPLRETTVSGEGKPKILLVDVSGVITDVPTRRAFGLVEHESTVSRVQAELETAADDDRVVAVVLRINSPGGGVTASDEVHGIVRRFREEHETPVVAALGNVATSGGYYVALAADTIVAHPTTVTGSIGVVLMSLNLEQLLGKVGVENRTFRAGRHKDLLSPLRASTPEEAAIVQGVLDSMHTRFIETVRARRPGLASDRLDEITDGRIFDARQALALGLVDEIAPLPDAIARARAAAGVREARVVMYQRTGEDRDTIYASRTPAAPQINVLPIDLGDLPIATARFMYLWAPGLVP